MSNEINFEENVQNELWNELQKWKVERKIKPATNLYHCVSSCLIHLVVVSHLKCILYSETGSGLETGDSPPAASPLWTPAHVSWWSPSEDSGWRCQHWPRWSCHLSASQSGNLLRIMDMRKILKGSRWIINILHKKFPLMSEAHLCPQQRQFWSCSWLSQVCWVFWRSWWRPSQWSLITHHLLIISQRHSVGSIY